MALLSSALLFLVASTFAQTSLALNNGLARTPPMGWLSWGKFTCNTDCENYPKECINEQLYKDMIDQIVQDGYLKAGYDTVNIDDCWMEKTKRDPNTSRLIPDHKRFPSGIKAIADYAHSKKVLLGIYEDVGTKTCMGYPGTYFQNKDHTMIDANTFAEWGVDSLKLDGCASIHQYNQTYPAYSKALNQVKNKHKIVFACSWPAYIINSITDHDFEMIRDNCNYWRNYGDIDDSFNTVDEIIEFYGKHVQQFIKYHGPGGWFDPDMLLIGNNGLSYEQSKTQMAFWCLWSAPLLMSNDLRTIKPEFKQILLNKHLIAVDQDPLGIMGHIVIKNKSNQVWVKKLSPEAHTHNSPYVVLYYNKVSLGVPTRMSYKLHNLIPELNKTISYKVHDLFDDYAVLETLKADQNLLLKVPTSGSVRMVKLVPES